MKTQRRHLIVAMVIIITQSWLVSCAGGHVSDNGIFEHGHRELKASLVGNWRIINPDVELLGEEVYTFYTENKNVKLKVMGKERVMERFDSSDGLSFSFEYTDDLGEKVYVMGQFKSGAKQSLMLMREPADRLKASLSSVLLQKRETAVKTVVAGTAKN